MSPVPLVPVLLAVLLLLPSGAGAARGGSPAKGASRELSGSRTVSGEMVVEEGETLSLLPGTTIRFRGGRLLVRGRLVAGGTAARPVRISGDDAWEGIEVRGRDGSRLEGTVVSGGRKGLTVTNARVELKGVRFEKSAVGLDVGQYARVVAGGCTFGPGGKVGAMVKRGGAASFDSCRFRGSSRAGLYVYGAKDVSSKGCFFENNAVGLLVSMYEGAVSADGCSFSGNITGLRAEKMAAPVVSGGTFSRNGTGLLFDRRAAGTVTGARIEENGEGVRVEYSSYPVFRENRFRGNREYAVRLVHQSSQWEEAATEGDREGGDGFSGAPFGGGRGDFRPGGEAAPSDGRPPAKDPKGGSGTVDFRGNDWGEGGIDRGGPGGRRAVRDGVDEPFFEYKGARYRMDRILY